MSELKVPAGKTVYWRGLTYTEGMTLPSDYPAPEHVRATTEVVAAHEAPAPARSKEK
jgi:hypothetical protein